MKNSQESMMNKNLLIDGHIRTFGLEFFAVDHCNLSCYGCAQRSPYLDKEFTDVAAFEKNIRILGKYLRPDKITIVGGEPLLHPDIDSIIRIAQKSNMFKEIHVTTNALDLTKMSQAFWQGIDVLVISKYPTTADFINKIIDEADRNGKLYNVEIQIRDMSNFNHITLSEENKNQELVKEIYEKCIYKYYCHTLSNDRIYRCSPVVNLDKYLKKFGRMPTHNMKDHLKIEDQNNFQTTLLQYLNSDMPLTGCNFCLGSSGKLFPHRQLSKKERDNPAQMGISSENHR